MKCLVWQSTAKRSKTWLYKALYGEGQVWARPLKMFSEEIENDGKKMP